MPHLIPCEQGTPEWHAARAGKITASRFIDARSCYADKPAKVDKKTGEIVEPAKRGLPNAASNNYAALVALERISGQPSDEGFESWQMRRGHELEREARLLYEIATGRTVMEAGLLVSDCGIYGYSTDGNIGTNGLAEIKCPTSPTKLLALWETRDVSEYIDQVQGGMWISGRQWCDLIVYAPQLKSVGRELLIIRIERDDSYISELAADLAEFAGRVKHAENVFRGIQSETAEVVEVDGLAIAA